MINKFSLASNNTTTLALRGHVIPRLRVDELGSAFAGLTGLDDLRHGGRLGVHVVPNLVVVLLVGLVVLLGYLGRGLDDLGQLGVREQDLDALKGPLRVL
jgi:hypothetical protein